MQRSPRDVRQLGLLPWHEDSWRRIRQSRRRAGLHHALLLRGLAGVGKRRFAQTLMAALLCDNVDDHGLACTDCAACRWFLAGSHPDCLVLEPEPDSRVIKIDQVRELVEFTLLTRSRGDHKVIVIQPADALNTAAANSLLKTLEEPPAGVILILVTANPAALAATLRSRCEQIVLPSPPFDVAMEWLRAHHPEARSAYLTEALSAAGGAPLAAQPWLGALEDGSLQAAKAQWQAVMAGEIDALTVASTWADAPERHSRWLIVWIQAMIRDRLSGLGESAVAINTVTLYARLDHALDVLRLANTPLNAQLLMDDLLIPWYGLSAPGHHNPARTAPTV